MTNPGIWIMMMVIIAVAARTQRLFKLEEEQMTKYAEEDLQGWEFKILRARVSSWVGPFKNPLTFKKVIEEEARSGWIFLEKFDDYRIRFKRQANHKVADSQSEIDPYRTTFGNSMLLYLPIIISLGLALTIGLFFFMSARIYRHY